MSDVPYPITPQDLENLPRAHATRLSYDWMALRYTVWIGMVPQFGWSVLCDDGIPGQESVVTSPWTWERCVLELAKYTRQSRIYPGLLVEDWEPVDRILDARIRMELSQ